MIICDDNSKKEYFKDIVNFCSYAKELLEKEKYDEAIKVVMSKIRIVEKYKTVGKKECFCFDELFEYEMYIHHKMMITLFG